MLQHIKCIFIKSVAFSYGPTPLYTHVTQIYWLRARFVSRGLKNLQSYDVARVSSFNNAFPDASTPVNSLFVTLYVRNGFQILLWVLSKAPTLLLCKKWLY
jgi:hypothetical protein